MKIKLYEDFFNEAKKNEARYAYKWGTWEAEIYYGMSSWKWYVESTGGEGDMYDFRSDIDDDFKTPKEAEADMMNKIDDKIGHKPASQAAQMK